jgi:hypothetical protein
VARPKWVQHIHDLEAAWRDRYEDLIEVLEAVVVHVDPKEPVAIAAAQWIRQAREALRQRGKHT